MHSTVWQRAAISNRAVNLQTVFFQCAFYNLMQLKWRNKLWTILLFLQFGGFTGKKRERTFMKFLLLVFLKIPVYDQADSDICKVFCVVSEVCNSVVSCFPLRSQCKSRYSYFSLLKTLLNCFLVSLLSGSDEWNQIKINRLIMCANIRVGLGSARLRVNWDSTNSFKAELIIKSQLYIRQDHKLALIRICRNLTYIRWNTW